MRIVVSQIIIISLLYFDVFEPVVTLLSCYLALFFGYRKMNLLNPVFWLIVAWNILFINAFSGVITYKYYISLENPILFSISLILVFLAGFYIHNWIHKHRFIEVKQNKFILFLKNVGLKKIEITIAKQYTIFSILAALLFFIEIVFIYGGNILAPSLLRETFRMRQATLLSQLSGLFFFGGLFSLTAFIFFRSLDNKTFYLIGIFAFSFGSILSAGRQMVFQLIVASILCLSILKYYKLKVSLLKIHKTYFLIAIFFISAYFIFISTARTSLTKGDTRTKLEIYSAMNNSEFSEDFVTIMDNTPSVVEDFLVDYLFYFSHEIYLFSEWWTYEDINLIDNHVLRFSPFLERQIDRLGIFGETQQKRYERLQNSYNKGTIIKQGWPTTNKESLVNIGYLGTFLLVFLHGFFSNKLYLMILSKPSFGLLNLCIANNIILFNTISNSAFSETQIMVYIFVSLYLTYKNI